MTAEIVSVGTELLLGNVLNTNSAFLAERLAFLGFDCYYQTVVGDDQEHLLAMLKMSLSRSDIVILSGGMGPADDDLTKETVAKAFSVDMVTDNKSKEHIINFFKKKNKEITENAWKQAMVPSGAVSLVNANGTATGVIMEEQGKTLVLLPGTPGELIPMFLEQVEPYLTEKNHGTFYSQMVKMSGVAEGEVEEQIKDLAELKNPAVATYARTGEVHVRVSATCEEEKDAKALVKPVVKEIKRRFGSQIYSTEPAVTLEDTVVELLVANNLTVSTVESCTGGMVAARLINVAGVSDVYKEGFVTYSNKAKRKRVDVRKSTLNAYGAVSEQTALEMAQGGCSASKSDACVSTTGIAGPGGGTDEKPVGLVYIGCCVKGETAVRECHFTGDRAKVRESACAEALDLLRTCILRYVSKTLR